VALPRAGAPVTALPRLRVPPGTTAASRTILSALDAHHARSVLRMRPGDRFIAFDGLGAEWDAEIVSVGDAVAVAIGEPRPPVALPYRLTIYQGLPKADKMDLIVRMGTELGAARFVPVQMKRSVARALRLDRWRRIAGESAKQCRRASVPDVADLASFDAAAAAFSRHAFRWILWEGGGDPLAATAAQARRAPDLDIALFVGPEGGIDDSELERLDRSGKRCSLGPLVLRVETAAAAAAAVLLATLGN
jgi:16S rRNA (uracil1498-N3)-methyltransferase